MITLAGEARTTSAPLAEDDLHRGSHAFHQGRFSPRFRRGGDRCLSSIHHGFSRRSRSSWGA
jgi:hypothetical protein